ncbi:hypothetical protein E3N88_13111 [Mikania micrantha]|uniref:Uncharacterized protein n=1 Tax=Mikania micrantha TaxID=192012 RepID=A0A5N6P988_9ASTR|nr:hypothetical protein E3N88_13111 [Mikania micrantha]
MPLAATVQSNVAHKSRAGGAIDFGATVFGTGNEECEKGGISRYYQEQERQTVKAVEDVKVSVRMCLWVVLGGFRDSCTSDERSQKCTFLGISVESKAYRLYDPIHQKIIVSKDVTFNEEDKWMWSKDEMGSSELIIPENYIELLDDVVDIPRNPHHGASSSDVHVDGVHSSSDVGGVQPSSDDVLQSPHITNVSSTSQQHQNDDETEAAVRTSKRSGKAPAWLNDYQSGEGLSDEEVNLALFSSLGDPLNYEQAAKDEKWMQAMEAEIKAIERNGTWELVDLPEGSIPIGVKWIYKTKLNEKGEIDKFKARLVVKGYAQQKGINYNEVFAPVARWDTIRTLVAVAAHNSWVVKQLDVKSAFLHGELKETIFVEQPKGFVKTGAETKVYKLKRALYGLKQAPRAWFTRIEEYFLREGFKKSEHDHTLFIKRVWHKILIISLYVDDLIYTGNDVELCKDFCNSMKREFEMTDLGQMKYFLGVEIIQRAGSISMMQKKYAKEILERFGLWEGNAIKNPIVPGSLFAAHEVKDAEVQEADETEYKCLPKEEHMQLVKRILRYVKGTFNYGITYSNVSTGKLQVFTDSNYAQDLEDRRCTSGYVYILSGSAICWSSRKQDIVALSSTEAEYVGAANCACHCVWLKGLLSELTGKKLGLVEIYCDNTSTINLSKNPVMHRRTKHIEVRYHFLRELVNKEEIKLVFCSSADQVADIMTKPIKLEAFEKLRGSMRVQLIED